MVTYSLEYKDGHLFTRVDGHLMLVDTGGPVSFGSFSVLRIDNRQFELEDDYMGLDAETLSGYTNVKVAGLIGADVLGSFDVIIDVKNGNFTVSDDTLEFDGEPVALDEFMGVPIVIVSIGGNDCRMFFDTGAQVSYLQDDSLSSFPPAGEITDFYPGIGSFQTDTYTVELRIGNDPFTVRCGSLPESLGMTLMMAETKGILGNQILLDRAVGYFQRRDTLIVQTIKTE